MENQNYNSQVSTQPNEMAGGVDDAVKECLCADINGLCMCTGMNECFCFESKENHATLERDAVEHSGAIESSSAVEQSGAVEMYTSGATQEDDAVHEDDATEEDILIREHPCVGRFRLEDTSTELLRCGIFALEHSTSSQLGMQMTQSEFWRAYDSQEMQAFNSRSKRQNRGNFHDDQLARVLCIWGRDHGRNNLQLGVIVEGVSNAYIMGDDDKLVFVSSGEDMENERDFATVWIHNDNAQDLHEARINHYSGITVLGRNEERRDSSEGKSSAEEGIIKMGDDVKTGQETGEEKSPEKESGTEMRDDA